MQFLHVSGVASAHQLWPGRTYVAPAKRGRRVAIGARPGRAAPNESIMNPRNTQEQIGLFPTLLTPPGFTQVDRIRAEAAHARDAAIAAMLRRGVAAIGRVLASVVDSARSWPERRAAYEDLRRLSDHQLADIGMTRGDIVRVFEPEFRMPARPANANQAPATARTQAA